MSSAALDGSPPSTRTPSSGGRHTPLRTRSLRGRLFWTVFGLVTLMVLVLGITTDRVLSARLIGELESRLTDRTVIATALVDQVTSQQLVDRLAGQGVSVRLVTADGTVYTSGPNAPVQTASASGGPSDPGLPGGPAGRPRPPGGQATVPVTKTGDLYQVSQDLGNGSTVTMSTDASEARRTLGQVRIALAAGGVLVVLLALAILRPLIGRALTPLDRITRTAQEIAAGDRGRRLDPDRPNTELGRTAVAFDTMLDAVEGAERQSRDSEQRLRDFLSDAAHELRTPVAGTLAACERLLRTDPDRATREALTVTAIREAQRAGRLVEQMLDMARIDQGLQLRTEPVDLDALARQVVQTKRLSAPGAQLSVAGVAGTVPADPDRITQVLVNLIDNALHASGPQAQIRLSTSRGPEGVAIEVSDNGPGVPPAERERIFDRLVRLDASRGRGAGAGLGLAISRGIARAHGGDLRCLDSDRGATFRLALPLLPPGAQAAPTPAATRTSAGPPRS